MNKIISVLLYLLSLTSLAQENLVHNPSFEEYIGCPTNGSWIRDNKVPPWKDVGGGGVRYFHECGLYDYTVPINYLGGQSPRTGQAYLGIGFWALYSGNSGRFVGIELNSSLIAGKNYLVEYHITLCDSSWYAIKNTGMYFSESQPSDNIDSLLSYNPQIKYEGDTFLYDKEKWVPITGNFIAEGGEKFITIGNFDGHDNTDTLFVGGPSPPSGQPDYYKVSIYFIDDVSITLDTTTGVNELEQLEFEVYPNPANAKITVELAVNSWHLTTVVFHDLTGREVLSIPIQSSKNTIDISSLSAGIYTAVLSEKGIPITRKKIIIE